MKNTTFLIAAALSFVLSAPAAHATTSILLSDTSIIDITAHSSTSFSTVGDQVAMGDLNGDGKDDLILSDQSDDNVGNNAGAAYVIYGDETSSFADMSLDDADASFRGSAAGDRLGETSIGDVNCDGTQDVIAGAKNATTNDGKAYVFFGSNTDFTGAISASSADVVISGDSGQADNFGSHVLNAGDINGDNCDDFLVSADNYDTGLSDVGAIYLFYGSSGLNTMNASSADAIFTGEEANDRIPDNGRRSDVWAALGDMNGDGFDDVIVAAEDTSTRGKVYVIAGRSTDYSGTIDIGSTVVFTPDVANAGSGISVSAAGDINNDGFADAIIGDNGFDIANSEGTAHIVYGESGTIASRTLNSASVDFRVNGAQDSGYTGAGVGGARDINNDGYDDIIVGSPEATFTGAARDFSGGASILFGGENASSVTHDSTDVLLVEDADQPNVDSGEWVGLADVNGDGFAEALVGEQNQTNRLSLVFLYIDADGDGAAGNGGLLDGTDCDDADASISQEQTYYRDSDGDGEGDPDNSTTLCSDTVPDGYVTNSDDVSGEVLGDIERVTRNGGTLTVRYANGTRTLQPYNGRKKFKYKVSVDDETLIVSNGKNVRAYVENQRVAGKKIHRKTASKKKHIRIKVKKLYRNKAYESVIVQSARKKKGRIAVLRLTSSDNLTKRKRKTFAIQKKSFMKLTTKRRRKRIIVQFGKRAAKVNRVYKLKKSGKLVSIN